MNSSHGKYRSLYQILYLPTKIHIAYTVNIRCIFYGNSIVYLGYYPFPGIRNPVQLHDNNNASCDFDEKKYRNQYFFSIFYRIFLLRFACLLLRLCLYFLVFLRFPPLCLGGTKETSETVVSLPFAAVNTDKLSLPSPTIK